MGETPNKWILEPTTNTVLFLGDSLTTLTLGERGLISLEMLPSILDSVARIVRGRSPSLQNDIARLRAKAAVDARLTAGARDRHVASMMRQFCVGSWSAIETMIEDTLIDHLINVPNAYEIVEQKWPILQKRRPDNPTDRGEARAYFRYWEKAVNQKNVVDRAMGMLSAFDLDFNIDQKNKDNLTEFNELRNILLHRKGIVDEYFLAKVPWSDRKVGDEYHISRDDLMKLYEAASNFTIGLMEKATQSPLLKTS